MPLISLPGEPIDQRFGMPEPGTADQRAAQQETSPALSQTIGAAFRQSNLIGSFLSREDAGLPDYQEPGFDTYAAIKGTPYEPYWKQFVDVHNRKAMGLRQSQIDMEQKDRDTLAQAGWVGTLAQIGSGVADPTIFLPVAGTINKVRGGAAILRGALATGASVAAATAVQETGLHATQQLRTPEESAWAIGSSALLGTLLGAGGAALLSRGEQKAATDALDRLRQPSGTDLNGGAPPPGAAALGAETPSVRPAGVDGAPVAGGADVPSGILGREDVTIAGTVARNLAEKTAELNPNLRLNTSPSTTARVVGQQLAENTLFQRMHDIGESLGPAAETLMRTTMHGRLSDAMAAHNDIFSNARKAGLQMTRGQFEDAIGEAMRRGDVGENDFVSQAARTWREKLFDPFKDEAINEGLLPADVSVDTADSYFRRLYNQQRMTAQEQDFKTRVSSYYQDQLAAEYGADVERYKGRVERLQTEVSDLKLAPEDRTKVLSDLESEQQQLYGNNPQHVDRADQIAQYRDDMATARESGDKAAYKAAQAAAHQLRAEGGKDFAKFQRLAANLNARQRNVNMNYAGIAEKSDTVMQSLADIEEANYRSMQRLITKGRVFEREARRLDPAKLSAKVEDIRSSIADQAARSQKAAERAQRGIERIDADAERRAAKAGTTAARASVEASLGPAEEAAAKHATASAARDEAIAARAQRDADIKTRLAKEAKSQAARAERMSRLADRLEQAQNLDPEALIEEVKNGVDKMAAEVSDLALSRGEKAQRLLDRLKSLDPKRVDDRLKAIDELQKELETKFHQKWELDRGGEGVDLAGKAVPRFSDYTREIADAVYDKLTGRGYDNNMPDSIVPATRGPLKERTFNIPDKIIEPFLESNIMHVAHDYARKMASEIELTRRFGSADMKEPLAKIQAEYADLRKQVADAQTAKDMRQIADRSPGAARWLAEKVKAPDMEATRASLLKYLAKSEKQDAEDVQAMRDLLRGTYKKANMNNIWGRTARGILTYNYITRLGGVILANISEVFRPAMVYGFRSMMGDGIRPLLSEAGRAAAGMSIQEAKLAGQVVERVLQHRMASLSEMGDPMARGSAAERLLDQGARIATRWNGLTVWTDGMKAVTSILAQNRILRAVRDGGDDRILAYLGIDPAMRNRIAAEIAEHGEEREGVMIANTEKWADPQAVRTYRAAMSKDIDSVIVTKSVGDVPLFANTPVGKLVTQFKAFALASHQRVLLRGLQENQARFIGGMVAMTTMGMLATYLRALSSNRLDKISADNSGWWIGEGLDQTGIFSVPLELANIGEKFTGINALKDPLRVGGAALTGTTKGPQTLRYGSRGDFGALLGPGIGMADDLITVLKTMTAGAAGSKVQPGQKKAAVDAALRSAPYYSYPVLRTMIDYLGKPALYEAVGAH